MPSPRPTICILGLGYIGLPTAAVLATKGYRIHGVRLMLRTVLNAMRLSSISCPGVRIYPLSRSSYP